MPSMYHISPHRNYRSIAARRLVQSDVDNLHIWLLRDLAKTQVLARLTWGGSRENDIWEIDTTGLNLIPDPHPGGSAYGPGQSWAVTNPIPAGNLHFLETVSPPLPTRGI